MDLNSSVPTFLITISLIVIDVATNLDELNYKLIGIHNLIASTSLSQNKVVDPPHSKFNLGSLNTLVGKKNKCLGRHCRNCLISSTTKFPV